MKEGSKAQFQFKNFFIKRSLIEQGEGEPSTEFSIGFKPKAYIDTKQSNFQLHLGLKINDKNKVINIEVDSVANYQFDHQISKDRLNQYFYTNAPAILFPYIRAYISTLTNLSGYKPINLPTLNLTSLREELEKNTTEAGEKEDDTNSQSE
jgi:preprotein translocase subunit SecB